MQRDSERVRARAVPDEQRVLQQRTHRHQSEVIRAIMRVRVVCICCMGCGLTAARLRHRMQRHRSEVISSRSEL